MSHKGLVLLVIVLFTIGVIVEDVFGLQKAGEGIFWITCLASILSILKIAEGEGWDE